MPIVPCETWEPCTRSDGYLVSDRGRVKSPTGHVLSRRQDSGKYLIVTLTIKGKREATPVHLLVCEAFHGPRPSPDHEASHLNGDPRDARACNLAWLPRRENAAQKAANLYRSPWQVFPRDLAEDVRSKYPELWRKHGTGGTGPDKTDFTGDDAFRLWGMYERGVRSKKVVDWVERRDRYAARHQRDYRVAGVIAAIKWGLVLPTLGVKGMMDTLGKVAK